MHMTPSDSLREITITLPYLQEFANQHSIQLPQRETRQNLATIYKAAEPAREPSLPEPFPSNILQVGSSPKS